MIPRLTTLLPAFGDLQEGFVHPHGLHDRPRPLLNPDTGPNLRQLGRGVVDIKVDVGSILLERNAKGETAQTSTAVVKFSMSSVDVQGMATPTLSRP